MTGEWPFGDLPRGQAAALAVDPPWSYSCFSEKGKAGSADRHYTTMASAAIEQLPVGELAARNAHLFLWVTGPCLVQGMHLPIMRAWGFEPSALAFVWIKPKLKDFANGGFFLDETLFAKGMGHTTRQNAEYVVLGRRGEPRRLRKDVHQLIVQPRREHSRKPDEFYARVQSYCAGPYVELFSRQRRRCWSCWGAELDRFEPEYDANADVEGSFSEAYAEIRRRVAAGGEPWIPKP
jgi:N6-adenosine-specific RNA methylase IME4